MAPTIPTRSGDAGMRRLLDTGRDDQHVSAAPIVGKCMEVSIERSGFLRAPVVFSPEQFEGWRERAGMQ